MSKTLEGLTGLHISRVVPRATAGGAVKTATARGRSGESTARVRPPADPGIDRLLVKPIFILSPVRSGSTLLRVILNAHSQLHAPHELHVRRLTVQFGTPLAEKAMTALGHNQADLEHLLWDRVLHRELVKSDKKYIVDKTPANAFAYKRIRTCWPDARFVFLLRHPMSIAQSWHEASPDRRDLREAALDSLRYMKAVEKARGGLDGLTVRYEDLTADPRGEALRICDFLAIPWEEAMLSYGARDDYTKGLGDWKDKIRSGAVQPGRDLPDPATILDELRPMCETWGYLGGSGA
ncbi:MAG TPA: sulfotransferase [Thermopolyspora sp.]